MFLRSDRRRPESGQSSSRAERSKRSIIAPKLMKAAG